MSEKDITRCTDNCIHKPRIKAGDKMKVSILDTANVKVGDINYHHNLMKK